MQTPIVPNPPAKLVFKSTLIELRPEKFFLSVLRKDRTSVAVKVLDKSYTPLIIGQDYYSLLKILTGYTLKKSSMPGIWNVEGWNNSRIKKNNILQCTDNEVQKLFVALLKGGSIELWYINIMIQDVKARAFTKLVNGKLVKDQRTITMDLLFAETIIGICPTTVLPYDQMKQERKTKRKREETTTNGQQEKKSKKNPVPNPLIPITLVDMSSSTYSTPVESYSPFSVNNSNPLEIASVPIQEGAIVSLPTNFDQNFDIDIFFS